MDGITSRDTTGAGAGAVSSTRVFANGAGVTAAGTAAAGVVTVGTGTRQGNGKHAADHATVMREAFISQRGMG